MNNQLAALACIQFHRACSAGGDGASCGITTISSAGQIDFWIRNSSHRVEFQIHIGIQHDIGAFVTLWILQADVVCLKDDGAAREICEKTLAHHPDLVFRVVGVTDLIGSRTSNRTDNCRLTVNTEIRGTRNLNLSWVEQNGTRGAFDGSDINRSIKAEVTLTRDFHEAAVAT